MSRRHRAEKREVIPDAKFDDVVVSKFINCLMLDGKKNPFAERIGLRWRSTRFSRRLEAIRSSSFTMRWKNVRPHIEVRSRRVGGATYQIPIESAL